MMLKVTNKNEFDLYDRYDGQDYCFPSGETVRCPLNVAKHIFGVGDPDKNPYLARQGWIKSSQEFEKGMEVLNNFVFEQIEEGPTDDLALIEQRKAPLQNQGAVEESRADDLGKSSAPAPKRSILKRLEQAPA